MTDAQKWKPKDLGNPVYAFLLAVFFQWGVALHDLEVDRLRTGETRWEDVEDFAKLIRKKAKKQALKDYVLFPALALPIAPLVFAGNATANLIRNLWAYTIIFCGHFPDGTLLFTEDEIEGESRGHWYVRQLLGSANIEGSPLFHIMSGNLSHQIEHHLFPDLPARRYQHIAAEVREICERNGLPYNTGSLSQQFGQVVKRICRLALPWTRDDAGRAPTAGDR
jgi:fatty acid desaturase